MRISAGNLLNHVYSLIPSVMKYLYSGDSPVFISKVIGFMLYNIQVGDQTLNSFLSFKRFHELFDMIPRINYHATVQLVEILVLTIAVFNQKLSV